MSILGPDGQPVTPPPTPPTNDKMRPGLWGIGMVIDPATGQATIIRVEADAGDIATREDPNLPAAMLLLRCRPTANGHLTFDSADDALTFIRGELDAVDKIAGAAAEVVQVAEAVTEQAAGE